MDRGKMKKLQNVTIFIMSIAILGLAVHMHQASVREHYLAKMVYSIHSRINVLEDKTETMALQIDDTVARKEFNQFKLITGRQMEEQKWQYEEYKGLDQVLDAWFGVQQADAVKQVGGK